MTLHTRNMNSWKETWRVDFVHENVFKSLVPNANGSVTLVLIVRLQLCIKALHLRSVGVCSKHLTWLIRRERLCSSDFQSSPRKSQVAASCNMRTFTPGAAVAELHPQVTARGLMESRYKISSTVLLVPRGPTQPPWLACFIFQSSTATEVVRTLWPGPAREDTTGLYSALLVPWVHVPFQSVTMAKLCCQVAVHAKT